MQRFGRSRELKKPQRQKSNRFRSRCNSSATSHAQKPIWAPITRYLPEYTTWFISALN